MSQTLYRLATGAACALAAATLGSCRLQDGPLGIAPNLDVEQPPAALASAELCKVGTDATFSVSVNNGTPSNVAVANGQCVIVHDYDGFPPDLVIITELPQAGVVVDSIVEDSVYGNPGTNPPTYGSKRMPTITGTDTDSVLVSVQGWRVTFFNHVQPPDGGGEGCTPGYWKQDQHFDSWPAPYTPSTQFSAVFENAFPGMTLLQVLNLGGGGLEALGRHTVAALLNAQSDAVDYDLSAQAVIDGFNAVFPGGDYEGQKNIFEGLNERGCSLD